MKIDQVHPELQKAFRVIPTLPFHNLAFVKLSNFLQKLMPEKASCDGVTIEQLALKGARLRIYKPPAHASGAALMWIHGGGLITGKAAQDDQLCATYARELGLLVISVDYRLAPTHPFPAAINDCYEAWQWLVSEAHSLGVNPARIAIAGQSAGAGLAASLSQRICDAGGLQPLAQALFCPMLDDRTGSRKELDAINHRIWNNKSNRTGWASYLGQSPGEPEAPPYAVAARRKVLAKLPPAWISAGDIDLFYEESRSYAERLSKADVDCQFHVVPMAPHAFETIAPKASITLDLYKSNFQFLRETLGLPSPSLTNT